MRIEKYVSQLLYRYPCVIIPGFGAFLTEIKSARLVEGANTFYPPYKSLSFNPHVKNNDGLLTNAIGMFEKLSFEQASKVIENAVLDWNKSIENSKTFSIEDIGSFTKNSEGNLVFEPYLYTNYLTDSFGLTPFVSPKVNRDTVITDAHSIVVNNPIVLEREPIVFKPKVSDIIPKIKNYNSTYLKYAAIFVLGIAIASSIVEMHNVNVTNETVLLEKAVHNKVENRIQQATFNLNIPQQPLPLPIKEVKAPFHVVASAFRDVENANAEVRILQIAGFNSRVLPVNKNGLHTVIYASYNNVEEARDFLNRIKATYNSQAWLLTENL